MPPRCSCTSNIYQEEFIGGVQCTQQDGHEGLHSAPLKNDKGETIGIVEWKGDRK